MRDSTEPPAVSLGWGKAVDPDASPESVSAAVKRRATVALVVHLVIAVCFFGIPSIAGAVVAGLARRAAAQDPQRAQRLLRWSWACIAVDLMFYLLLLAVCLVLAGYLFLASRSGAR